MKKCLQHLILTIAFAIGTSLCYASDNTDWIYIARPGDTLQTVAKKYLKDGAQWADLLRHNQISATHILKPGAKIRIPVRLLKSYPIPAEIMASQGEVWIRKAHSTPYVVALNKNKLSIGDELKTHEGFAIVKFADGSVLNISPHSIVIFNTLSHYGSTGMVDTRIRLLQGGIRNQVQRRKGPSSRYEVSTPSAVAAVRGTVFRMRQSGNQTTTEVIEGKVSIRNINTGVVLTQGQGTVSSQTGQIKSIPLLPAPEMSLPKQISTLPYQLNWSELNGADRYIIAIHSAENENSLPIHLAKPENTQYTIPNLENGQYKVYLRGIDIQGIEGLDAVGEFEINQEAAPAELLTPFSEATLDNLKPQFRWKLDDSATMLSSLEISKDPNFETLFSRTPFTYGESAVSERPLIAGNYYWRVVTLAGGNRFAYSNVRKLSVYGALPATQIIAVNYIKDRAKVFWKSVPNAYGYHVQLAEDELFRRLVKESQQDLTHATLRLIPGKSYWVRVKGVGSNFYESSFGQSHIIRLPSQSH